MGGCDTASTQTLVLLNVKGPGPKSRLRAYIQRLKTQQQQDGELRCCSCTQCAGLVKQRFEFDSLSCILTKPMNSKTIAQLTILLLLLRPVGVISTDSSALSALPLLVDQSTGCDSNTSEVLHKQIADVILTHSIGQ